MNQNMCIMKILDISFKEVGYAKMLSKTLDFRSIILQVFSLVTFLTFVYPKWPFIIDQSERGWP